MTTNVSSLLNKTGQMKKKVHFVEKKCTDGMAVMLKSLIFARYIFWRRYRAPACVCELYSISRTCAPMLTTHENY